MSDSRRDNIGQKSTLSPGHTLSPGQVTDLRQSIELLFFAYRDFIAEPDAILARYGFGRAHHRVIYFVGRNPGIGVSRLLEILQITKQSLARVLRQLIDEEFIEQRLDREDGRRRLLHLLDKGVRLESQLTRCQAERIAAAFEGVGEGCGGQDVGKGFRDVLRGMMNEKDRPRVRAVD